MIERDAAAAAAGGGGGGGVGVGGSADVLGLLDRVAGLEAEVLQVTCDV